ncbi:sulfatase [Saccharopolyspora rhizosphaerae]|uniref:Sulfatase n=1 Tax=Saccharopolyspora rhizosphaerae TaxID=2492662 RepID=A0A3R8Q4F1_9PSEU|nr:sulfatase-like hydrolase/transferase [Saccharopolyspora rhizosphaerae]RRO16682.1 sulfatase [Saccharopolyspora rhizosphaerae]
MSGALSGSRPHIVLIVLDDLGLGDLSWYGSQTRTPRIDEIGRDGMTFRQAYAGAPICTPSRAALLTGRYAQRVGLPVVLWPEEPRGLPEFERTVAEALRSVGYRTGIFGKWHLGDPMLTGNPWDAQPRFLPSAHGFDHFCGIPYSNDQGWGQEQRLPLYRGDAVAVANVNTERGQERLAAEHTDAAIAFIRQSAALRRPFFAYLPHSAVHQPFHVPEETGGVDGSYPDLVREVDRQVGRVLDELRALRLAESTLVVLTSDNGPWFAGSTGGLRGRKTDPFEGGVRVPFLVRWPGRVPVAENRYPISFVDVLPTLVDLAGAAPPPPDRPVDGISIVPALAGEPMPRGRTLYFYGDFEEGPTGEVDPAWVWNVAALRQDRWKLLWPATVWPDLGREALFDLEDDPGETTDVSAAHPLIRDALAERARIFNDDVRRHRAEAVARTRRGR